jgi:HK97 family phage prohead protease
MIERRSAKLEQVSLRAEGSGDLTLSGVASRTGVWYEVGVGWYREMIMPGAFKRSLNSGPDVALLLQHGDAGSGLPLARTTAKTLDLFEDQHGLSFVANLDPQDPDTQLLARKLARGDMDGQMSFAFTCPSGGDSWNDTYDERTISQCAIHRGDISAVVNAASPTTYSAINAEPMPRSYRIADPTRLARLQYEQLRDKEMLRQRRSATR